MHMIIDYYATGLYIYKKYCYHFNIPVSYLLAKEVTKYVVLHG